MKKIRPRFLFWALGFLALFLLANFRLRAFPHILLIFWLLLPLLSILFSKFSDRKLKAHLVIRPNVLEAGEEGKWICDLKNESQLMAFFLKFPDLFLDHKRKKPLRVMLQPGEEKRVILSFTLPHIGPYTLKTQEPIYEDLLGFIRLSFDESQLDRMLFCYGVPSRGTFSSVEEGRPILDELGKPILRKNLTSVTDDVYSIDPIQSGESLSHVHWKLSARLQDWMVKRYSDFQQEPARIVVHPRSCSAPTPQFLMEEERKSEEEDLLRERDAFLTDLYSLAASLLEKGDRVSLADCRSRYESFNSSYDLPSLQAWFGRLPFDNRHLEWKMEVLGDKVQLVFLQCIDEKSLGSLLHFHDLGVYFVCFSYRAMNSEEMVKRVEKSEIRWIWLDED